MYKTNTIQCLGKSNKELFFSFKNYRATFIHEPKKEKKKKWKMKGITNVLNWILWRDPVSFSSLFPSCPALVGDRTCPLWFGAFFFEMFHLLGVVFFVVVFIFFFFYIVLCCETVSPPGRSTHSVREKRLTFHLKLAQET